MKRLCKTLLCLFITTAIITVGLFSAVFLRNSKLVLDYHRKSPFLLDFDKSENSVLYAEEVTKDEIDLKYIHKNFFNFECGLMHPDIPHWVAAPKDISYYADINDTTPVYTIEKGTYLYYNPADCPQAYYGIQSLPTHQAGWRIAKPFKVANEEPIDTVLYVKTSDLVKVSYAWGEENFLFTPDRYENTAERLFYKHTTPYLNTFRLDRDMYSRDIFLSPDLVSYIYPPAPFISLGVSAILLAAYLALRRKVKKSNK